MGTNNLVNTISLGNARDLINKIDDASIDLVLCDPIYWNIDDYEWLARESKRVLKPYKYCIVQSGTYHLCDCMIAMQKHLDYYWLISEQMSGGALPIFVRRITAFHKPYLWFANGIEKTPARAFVPDVIKSTRNKSHHKWGNDTQLTEILIDRLTVPGDIVLDPFSGSGLVAGVCQMLHRTYISFEIDEETRATSLDRINNMPIKNSILLGIQETMEFDDD